jgi:light-regulated signal transduction histidine kinase (bacteriophytochrome)
MNMSNPSQRGAEPEFEGLRQPLDAETSRCLDLERQLQRANSEFEEFVSVAAHELRQSLRDVAAFSQLLAEASANALDSDSIAYLAHIREGAAKMETLTGDVVDYWTTATDRQSVHTDMEAVLFQALLSMEKQVAERRAQITHDPLPPVWGDFATLVKVLRHLIRNAVEYCVAAAPRVHISCQRAGADWTFAVADNGPGIEAAYHERIFAPFKRLHGKEYPGNGLGLAWCRKAVASDGGRIWVESSGGTGSTFYFTLPAAD